MLIIFGTKVRTSVIRAVVFFCPGCGGDRPGALCQARRWFTLFFLPVLPLKVVGEVVRCDTCKRMYPPTALERPTTGSVQDALTNAVRAVVVMVVATGDRGSSTLRGRAVQAIAMSVPGYADDTLEGDLAAIDPAFAEQYAAPLADGLEPAGRERFLADVVAVAVADGPLTPAQRDVVDQAGRGLGLSPAHVTGIVATASPAPPAPPSSPTPTTLDGSES